MRNFMNNPSFHSSPAKLGNRGTILGLWSLLFVLAAGCTGPKGNQGPPGSTGPAGSLTGTTSGGGGYLTKDSKIFLKIISSSLASRIRRADPQVFSHLPKDWNQNRLAQVIENIRLYDGMQKQREAGVEGEGEELMFDYGIDQKGPYIAALRQFFIVYGSEPATIKSYRPNEDKVVNLYLKLLHEVAHFFPEVGSNDAKAEVYAQAMLKALGSQFILCAPAANSEFQQFIEAYFRSYAANTSAFDIKKLASLTRLAYLPYTGEFGIIFHIGILTPKEVTTRIENILSSKDWEFTSTDQLVIIGQALNFTNSTDYILESRPIGEPRYIAADRNFLNGRSPQYAITENSTTYTNYIPKDSSTSGSGVHQTWIFYRPDWEKVDLFPTPSTSNSDQNTIELTMNGILTTGATGYQLKEFNVPLSCQSGNSPSFTEFLK